MKVKITQFIPALIAFFFIGFRYLSLWCIFTVNVCYGTVIDHISLTSTKPLYFFSLYFLPLALILIFVPRHIFNSWLKLAVWAVPLSIIFIFTTAVNSTRMGIEFFPFYRDDAARSAAEIFSIASLVVIVFTSLLSRLRARVGSDIENIERETKELKALFAAGIGGVSIAICAGLAYTSSLSQLDTFLLAGAISLLANLYVLYGLVVLLYEKKQRQESFGPKLIVTITLFGISSIVYAVFLNLLFW